jgi:hypothetical protein
MIICRGTRGNPHIDCTMLEFLVTGHAAAPITAFSARINVPILGG